jgi:hypothetical protein
MPVFRDGAGETLRRKLVQAQEARTCPVTT